jgi:rhodanese-related sulfurtransferase
MGILLAVIVLWLAWDAAWWLLGVKPRFPWQLKDEPGAGASGPVLLDVRTPLEYNWFHLPGAQNVPNLLWNRAEMPPVPTSREVVVVCMTGHRSPVVAYVLRKRGYSRVYHLPWGMLGYKVYEWLARVGKRREPPAGRGI